MPEFDPKSGYLVEAHTIRAGDEYLTYDSKWHRASANAKESPAAGYVNIHGVSRESSETVYIGRRDKVQFLGSRS
jgi:hypothetical protein